MFIADVVGSVGVLFLLLAYFLNVKDIIAKESNTYVLLNIFGAGLACLASVLLKYLPFIILEACWFLVSIIAFANSIKNKKKSL